MHRRRSTVALLLVALALGAPAGARAADCTGADVVPAADNLPAISQATLCLLNEQRAAQGLPALTENPALTGASTSYSQRMVEQAFFAHESPDGGTLVSRLTIARYLDGGDDWVVGENIGWGQGPLSTPRSMVTAWMDSAGHRSNILSGEYREIGLGLALGTPPDRSWGATYTTDFGRQAERPAVAGRAASRRPVASRRTATARAAACARAAQSRERGATSHRRTASSHGRGAHAHKRGRSASRQARRTCARLALV